MHYGMIKKFDIADGLGVRVSIFVSGCTNHCEQCFQPETWDFQYGSEYTKETEDELLASLKESYIQGLSLLGGEPFEPENQQELVKLLRRVRAEVPEKNVWCYTGFRMDVELKRGGRKYCEYTDEMLSMIDVLVDGKFELAQKDIQLKFRGSRNQRLIDVPKSLAAGSVVLLEL